MTDRAPKGALGRWPLIASTLIVLAAVAVMVRLGFWQLDRLAQKERMIAAYISDNADRTARPLPDGDMPELHYRRVSGSCRKVEAIRPRAGRNNADEAGWAQVAVCETTQAGGPWEIVLGWSRSPQTAVWQGGEFVGTYVPRDKLIGYVVADPPLAGLIANAKPDPSTIPNNHLAYAVQWFLFALTALVIYALALRTRLRG